MGHRGNTAEKRDETGLVDADQQSAKETHRSRKPKRTCVLVLGMHRSGTSALTRALSFLGAELPKKMLGANPSNEAGHWEPARLIELHDRLLAEAGSQWSDWRTLNLEKMPPERLEAYRTEIAAIVNEDYGQSDTIVLKEPRICRFAPWFTQILREQGYGVLILLPFRNPLEVAASLLQRDSMPTNQAVLLWLRSTLDAEYASRSFSRRFVAYEDFLDSPRNVLSSAIQGLGVIDQRVSDQIWKRVEEFVSSDLRRQRCATDDLELNPLTRSWLFDLFQACRVLQRDENDKTALKIFDQIRSAFEEAMPLLSALASDIPAANQAEVERRINDENSSLKEALEKQSNEISQIRLALSQSETLASKHEKEVRRQLKRSEKIRADYDEKTKELNETRYRLGATEAQIESLVSRRTIPKSTHLKTAFKQLVGDADRERLLITESLGLLRGGQIGQSVQMSMQGPEFDTPPLVTVVVPVKNGLPHFEAVMKMLGRQKLNAGFEVIVIDSGSSDGSLAAVPTYDPRFRVIEIEPQNFGHGKTRNLGVQEAKGEYCAFLTHDALPTDENWLSALVKPLQADPDVAGVFGRHIAYPTASPYTKWELDTHFEGLRNWPIVELDDAREYVKNQGLRQVYHFYSDNSSCLRKSVWRDIPYPDVDFSEDQLWAKQIVEAGYKKAFAWDSIVYHSHEYSVWQRLKRSYDEARAFNRLFDYELCSTRKQAILQAVRVSARDLKLALHHGWIVKNPVATLVKPLDNLATQVGYYLGSSSWGHGEERARLLSRDKALKAQ